jgi:hypothetical protein
MILNILIPTNSPPTLNDAFLNQCKNILKSLSKKSLLNQQLQNILKHIKKPSNYKIFQKFLIFI